MKNAVSLVCVLVFALFVSACSSVPDVENRLQSLRLHSNMYVVQAGETVESIAYRYRLSPVELESMNPGIGSSIAAGMRINVRPGTTLANEVRTRATYAPPRQPRLISERSPQQQRPQQPILASNEVNVAPPAFDPEIRLQPVPRQQAQVTSQSAETIIEESAITEIPAASWDKESIVVAQQGSLNEEIIPDPLDYEPVQSNRAQMNKELQQLVGRWAWPTQGQIAREFAPSEVGGQGVDIAGVPGQDIRAAQSGTVVYSGRDLSGGGNLIIVRHNDGLMTTYSHADQLYVAEDDRVSVGDPIASLGWNSNRESVLRFEVRENGSPRDPMSYLPALN